MKKGNFPNGKGNAECIKSKRIKGHIFPIRRLEYLFDFLAEEPDSIFVKENENSERKCFRRILLIRVWRQKHHNFSWSIYSKEKENFDSLIIRKVVWDLDGDTELYKEIIKEKKNKILESWPTVEIYNVYLAQDNAKKINRLITKLDSEIENGFGLSKKSKPIWEWRDLEIIRLYKKKLIHFTWSPEKENKRVQNKLKKILFELNLAQQKANKNIFEMILNYSKNPTEYKEEECMIEQKMKS